MTCICACTKSSKYLCFCRHTWYLYKVQTSTVACLLFSLESSSRSTLETEMYCTFSLRVIWPQINSITATDLAGCCYQINTCYNPQFSYRLGLNRFCFSVCLCIAWLRALDLQKSVVYKEVDMLASQKNCVENQQCEMAIEFQESAAGEARGMYSLWFSWKFLWLCHQSSSSSGHKRPSSGMLTWSAGGRFCTNLSTLEWSCCFWIKFNLPTLLLSNSRSLQVSYHLRLCLFLEYSARLHHCQSGCDALIQQGLDAGWMKSSPVIVHVDATTSILNAAHCYAAPVPLPLLLLASCRCHCFCLPFAAAAASACLLLLLLPLLLLHYFPHLTYSPCLWPTC